MRSRLLARLAVVLVVVAGLCVTVAPRSFTPVPAAANTTANGGSVALCGIVTGYTPATLYTPGSIIIGGVVYGIEVAGTLINANLITSGANICVQAVFDGSGNIAYGTVVENTGTGGVGTGGNFRLCGVVSFLAPPSFGGFGSITINGRNVAFAPGAFIFNLSAAGTGNDICLIGTLNSAGQISSASVTADVPLTIVATAPTTVCGVVSSYTPASATTFGSVVIGGATYSIVANSSIGGSGLLSNGANVCLQLTLNSAGQITLATVTSNGGIQVSVCGPISSYTAATSTVAGLLTIAGITFPVAANATVSGPTTVTATSTLGLTLSINGQGQVTAANITSTSCTAITISGPITGFVPATATSAGSITIAGFTFSVAVGTVLNLAGVPLSARAYSAHAGLHPGREIPI